MVTWLTFSAGLVCLPLWPVGLEVCWLELAQPVKLHVILIYSNIIHMYRYTSLIDNSLYTHNVHSVLLLYLCLSLSLTLSFSISSWDFSTSFASRRFSRFVFSTSSFRVFDSSWRLLISFFISSQAACSSLIFFSISCNKRSENIKMWWWIIHEFEFKAIDD